MPDAWRVLGDLHHVFSIINKSIKINVMVLHDCGTNMEEEWYLTLSNISLCWEAGEENDVDSPEEIGVFLKRELKNIGVDLKLSTPKDVYNNPQVINVGREFPVALLKSLFIWETGKKLSMNYAAGFDSKPEFIVGNHYAAFTNNSRLNYYVPSIKRGFETIQDVLNAVAGDLSDCRILKMQYIDLHNLPKSVESSEILNPYSILDEEVLRKRFPALVRVRRKIKNAYMHELLEKISQVSFDRPVVCCDIFGDVYLINASKIIQIIPDPNREDNENLKTIIVLESTKSIEVNLEEFTTKFTGLSSTDSLSLPTSLIVLKEKSFLIEQPREDESYSNIWKKYEEDLIDWKKNHVWSLMIEPKFDDAKEFSDGAAWVKEDGKWGLINIEGEWIIKPRFDDEYLGSCVRDFSDGVAWVRESGKWGLINIEGEWIIKPRFDDDGYLMSCVQDFSDGVAWVRESGKWGLINIEGEWIIKPRFGDDGYLISWVQDFSDGVAWVEDGEWGLIDREGEWIIEPRFDDVRDFADGVAWVREGCKWGLINREGEWIIEPRFDGVRDFADGVAWVREGGEWGLIDRAGKWIIEPRFDDVQDFADGVAWVKEGGEWGLIDRAGKWIIAPRFDAARDFEDGVAWVKQDGRWGCINRKGRWLFKPKFENLSSFKNGIALVEFKGKFEYIVNYTPNTKN